MSNDKKSKKSSKAEQPKKFKIDLNYAESEGEANDLLSKADRMLDAKTAAMEYFNLQGPKSAKEEDKKAPPRLALSFDPNLTENVQGVKTKTKGLLPDALI